MLFRQTTNILTLLAALLLLAPACTRHDSPGQPPVQGAVLVVDVEAVGQSRGTAPAANELMHSVRIVIVDSEGKVESNRHAGLGSGVQSHKFLAIPVTPGKKRIYLVANEESVAYETAGGTARLADLLEAAAAGSEGLGQTLEDMVFRPDYGKNIPMSAIYDTELVKGDNRRTFHVVRTATKFDVSITNNRSKDIELKHFGVNSIADLTYLYPKFNAGAGIITAEGKKGFVFDSDTPLHWAEWLAKASDESQALPDAPQADKRGWIMEYGIPAEALQTAATWRLGQNTVIAAGAKLSLPTHYFAESCRLLPEGSAPFVAAATGLEQEYIIDIEMTSGDESRKYSRKLTNLRALFRNTHVNIEITVDDSGMEWQIYARPWNLREHPEIIM